MEADGVEGVYSEEGEVSLCEWSRLLQSEHMLRFP